MFDHFQRQKANEISATFGWMFYKFLNSEFYLISLKTLLGNVLQKYTRKSFKNVDPWISFGKNCKIVTV